jgi:4-hydroxy-3-polyprenylbenzoate decarboxylase
MAYSGLHQFISALDRAGELTRVKQFVNPELEITEIVDRVSKTKNGGKALLFENTGTSFPLLINALGSEKRVNIALGVADIEEIGNRINDLFKEFTSPKDTIFQKLALIPRLSQMSSWMPRKSPGKGKCQEVVMKYPDLNKLPVLTCWPFDGGPFITLPMVITTDPESNMRNVGMYRMQVFNSDVTGMHWHRHKTGARHFQKYKSLGRKMPVAVALGGDPAYIYAATAPLPENIDEFILAGFLRKKKVELVKAITQDIEVPADADFIIEGYVDPEEELTKEGPFGDHTGFYSLEDFYPKFHVTCITHRKNAVYPATIVGVPPQEDTYIGLATERIFLSPIKISIAPEIKNMVLPPEGVAHNLSIVQIENEYPGQAVKVANALWGAGQMMFNKIAVITTDNINSGDYTGLVRTILSKFNPASDIHFGSGPLDVLDHASDVQAMGGKMCIDCTSNDKQPEHDENTWKPPDGLAEMFPRVFFTNFNLLKENIPVVFFSLKVDTYYNQASLLTDIFKSGTGPPPKIAIIYDEHVQMDDISLLTWICLSNIDPQRDCHVEVLNEHRILMVDATSKYHRRSFNREWPNVVASSDEIIEMVNKRWSEYGLGDFISSPSLHVKSLIPNEGATVKIKSTL